jgi:hypothetical protein
VGEGESGTEEVTRTSRMDSAAIIKRIDELLAPKKDHLSIAYSELLQGTTSIMTLVYGSNSFQLKALQSTLDSLRLHLHGIETVLGQQSSAVRGALQNIRSEVEAGLIVNLTQQITGDVLTDFIALARTALDQNGDGPKNVAAVLAAAAFEDTIRRMGESLAGITGRPDLQDVLIKLKVARIIQPPQIGIAQSYLKFRNDALHADWNKIDRTSVHSVLAFVEQLLLKHFSQP